MNSAIAQKKREALGSQNCGADAVKPRVFTKKKYSELGVSTSEPFVFFNSITVE